MPVLPYLSLLSAAGFERMVSANRLWMRATAMAALAVLLISALEIRFAPRHRRDDYRTAATEALQAITNGRKVLWAADCSAARYYHVPVNEPAVILGSAIGNDSLRSQPAPDLVFLSKPDIYDPKGVIRNYLRNNDFKVIRELQAFRIFARSTAPR